MNLIFKHWGDLSTEELYRILQLRQEVFVVEQHCPYQDCDDHDQRGIHLWSEDVSGITAYARILPAREIYREPAIGRVITARRVRREGLGRKIMAAALDYCSANFGSSVRIMAQSYLLEFYESFGFVRTGEEFLEDGLPHWEMVLKEPPR